MKLKYYGHACFGMTFEDGTRLVTDPFDPSVGYPVCREKADIVLTSHDHHDHDYLRGLGGAPLRIRDAGPHEARGLRVTGIDTFHDDCGGEKRGRNVIFRIEGDGLRIAHLGDLGHPLSDRQIAALGPLDVMMIPIGGYYTIDARQAVEIARAVRPAMTVGMHFKTPACDYPIANPAEFLALTGGEALPVEIDLTPYSVHAMPAFSVMAWE